MFESILLGIIQGLTEFLPVSSSGHLVLAQSLLPGFDAPAAAFDVLLHGGTLIAVVAYFHRDIWEILAGMARPGEGGLRMPGLLLIATLPAGVVGVFFADTIEPWFASPRVASIGLLITSGLLVTAARLGGGVRTMEEIGPAHALAIGCFQALAIMPGISRSGATIAIAIVMGFLGTEAARFSFILSLPAVAGAMVLQSGAIAGAGNLPVFAMGALAAAVSGWLAIFVLMKLLVRDRLIPFAVYCLALGTLSLLFLA